MHRFVLVFSSIDCLASVSLALNHQDPVCIMGAGPAGLSTAYFLQEKDHSVYVFEKEASVGGKAKSFIVNYKNLFLVSR